MRLTQPEQEHITLEPKFTEQTETGAWFFYPEKRLAEPWVCYPAENSSVFLRPILWNGCNEKIISQQSPLDILTLHSAVTLDNTKLRHLVIEKILLQMCFDFNHSGWSYLKKLWESCSHLPLSSFDVWSLAVKYHQVLTALVLQMDENFIDKLNEELPVFWELIPLKFWLATFKHYKIYLQQLIDDKNMIKELIEQRINHIVILSDSMEIIVRILKQQLLNISDQELDFMSNPIALNMVVLINIEKSQQELNIRQANNQWLTLLQSELIRDWHNLDRSQKQLLNLENIPKHHLSVVTLPVILSVFCIKSLSKIKNDSIHILMLKQLKAFDEEWFNLSFKFSLAYFSQQPEYKTQLEIDSIRLIDINKTDIEQLDKEIIQLTCELKTEIKDLKEYIKPLEKIEDVSEKLELLRKENDTLDKSANSLRDILQKQDEALNNLLQEVKKLNVKLNEVRFSITHKNSTGA
jgi:hypothetical protein